MMNKEKWLKAYQKTYWEYKNDIHYFDESCTKCKVTERAKILSKRDDDINKLGCENCPESVFQELLKVGCVARKARAGDSRWLDGYEKMLILYYHEKAIEALEKMPEWDLKQFQQELVKINDEIWKIYNRDLNIEPFNWVYKVKE